LHHRWSFLILLATTSALSTGLLFLAYPALDPASAWNDHYFYWGQANIWLGLDQPLNLSSGAQELLDKYRVDYYYEVANGSSQQPPYAYRVGIPLVAGALGLALPLEAAFLSVTVASFILLGMAAGAGVAKLSGSRLLGMVAVPLSLAPVGLTSYTRFFALVDLPSISIVALTLTLVVYRKFQAALLVAAIVAPLVKETTVGLAAFVAIYMWLIGERGVLKWVAAGVPPLIVVLLRLYVDVPRPPETEELFVAGNPFEAVNTFILAYGVALPLLLGLVASRVRPLAVAAAPLIVTLEIVNSSVVASGPRIWLTIWPLIVVLGLVGLRQLASNRPTFFGYLAITLSGFILAHTVALGILDRIVMTVWLVAITCAIAFEQALRYRRIQESQRGKTTVVRELS